MSKIQKAVHTPAEVCSCTDNLFATPKTVRTPAEVCSLKSEFEGGPKTVCSPAEVCSLRFDSENCPSNCRGLQFELHICNSNLFSTPKCNGDIISWGDGGKILVNVIT